jgi:radical SAM superfamily enzyme YgiQ (UPF0313 family)
MDLQSMPRRASNHVAVLAPRVLLIGPCDPHCGEFTFLAPPLGVWRLQGVLSARGIFAEVFDPNLQPNTLQRDFETILRSQVWDIIGVSTTGMTLPYDLGLAHTARFICPSSLLIAGGMEATFNPRRMFDSGPFDLVIAGEGEPVLLRLCACLQRGEALTAIPGAICLDESGELKSYKARAMTAEELRDAIFHIPYERMPYERYWNRLQDAYSVASLPTKAQREASLSEIRSVRLITLNYCPMGCSFCSSTNFLHEAQGSVASIARLNAEDCLVMLKRIVAAHPTARTVIFQDDIFVFTNDKRLLALCEAIIEAKRRGELPDELQFISTNRIDAMTPERLLAMRRAGFRVLGFGVENFSRQVLTEFNKKQIYRHIDPMLSEALRLGITPFLDIILTSPRATLADLAETVRQAQRWIDAGCEIGIYPYVIPFSGAAMASDPSLRAQTIYETRTVAGTAISWQQPTKILPADPKTRDAILRIEHSVDEALLRSVQRHLPSRARSLLWIRHAIPVLKALGEPMPELQRRRSPRSSAPEVVPCAAT